MRLTDCQPVLFTFSKYPDIRRFRVKMQITNL